jgi:radical SAM protein with 4Fe4S-binding SPASM domain
VGDVSIPEISLTQLCAEQQFHARRVPLEGCIEMTFRCNLNCVHCYVNQPARHRDEAARELSREQLEHLIDEIADAGCLHLLLTGGEILVRPDFPDTYRHAIRRGLRVSVFTNGTLVTDAIVDLFDDCRPASVEITLYGATRQTYEKVSRVPGSFEQCLGGITRLASRRIPLKLKAMALAWNHHEVGAMREFARGLGLDFRHDALLNARLDCGTNRHRELQLSVERTVELDLEDPARRRDLQRLFPGPPPEPEGTEEAFLYRCGAGQYAFTIDPYGQLHICELSRRHPCDVRNGGFVRGWNERLPALRQQRWSRASPCRSCALSALCGSCAGACELEHGDPETPIAHFCRIAHRRAYALSAIIPGHRADASCCLGDGC